MSSKAPCDGACGSCRRRGQPPLPETAGRILIVHFFVCLLQFLVIVALGVLVFRWVTRRRKDAVADHNDRTE